MAKCGGRKPHKGQSPTAVFWNPRARKAPEALTVCYAICAVMRNYKKQKVAVFYRHLTGQITKKSVVWYR